MLKHRLPTEQELTTALVYIEREFVINDGLIHSEHWIEGLAFGGACALSCCAADEHFLGLARAVKPQLTELQWLDLAAAADNFRLEQCMPRRFSEVAS